MLHHDVVEKKTWNLSEKEFCAWGEKKEGISFLLILPPHPPKGIHDIEAWYKHI
jgi:hypothetical protein